MVKRGNARLAKVLYANAKLSPSYSDWPYKELLEHQIETADQRAREFPAGELPIGDESRWMPSSSHACMVCHESLAAHGRAD